MEIIETTVSVGFSLSLSCHCPDYSVSSFDICSFEGRSAESHRKVCESMYKLKYLISVYLIRQYL